MSLVLHFRFFKMAAVRHLRFLNVRNICRAIHYYVRTYAKISVTRIFCTCYLLSVCNNCVTYVQPGHDDRILFTERLLQWAIRRAR